MIRRLFCSATAALLLMGAAQAPSLERFEVARAAGWAEALAVCDLAQFLLEHQALDADVILAKDDRTGQFLPLYGPRFLPPNLVYDGAVRRAFYRLERAGELNRRDLAEARFRLDRPMLRAFRRMRLEERRFLEDQVQTCTPLLARAGR